MLEQIDENKIDKLNNNNSTIRSNIKFNKTYKSKKPLVIFYSLIVILFCTMVLTYVWSFVKRVEIKVTITKLNSQYENLLKQKDKLLAERAQLSATNRIEQIAREKLKMTLPTKVEYISLIQTQEINIK